MIHHTPEPRLEPDHREDIIFTDEPDTDFIQPIDDAIDESFLIFEEGEIRDLIRREPW